MEEAVDQLQWKKYLTTSNGRSPSPAAKEGEIDHLQKKK